MSAYSYDLRVRVMNAVDSGTKISEVVKMFKINRDTVYEWIKLKKKTGDVKSKVNYQKGHSHKIQDMSKFKAFIEKNYDKTITELQSLWHDKISRSSIFKYIKQLGYTYKKNSKPSQNR